MPSTKREMPSVFRKILQSVIKNDNLLCLLQALFKVRHVQFTNNLSAFEKSLQDLSPPLKIKLNGTFAAECFIS
jgi:hypothetical protein